MDKPTMRLGATVLGAPDPRALAGFYRDLLGWQVTQDEPDWVHLEPPGGRGAGLSFQIETEHRAPVWPAHGDDQQMMMHLDIEVQDLEAGVARAEELGATQADFQPQELVRVMIDPAGHPFCLYLSDG